jgi:zinc protease
MNQFATNFDSTTKLFVPTTRIVCCAVLLGLLSFLTVRPASSEGIATRVSEKILPNGLKIILLEDHKAPVVTFQVWHRVGSRNEEWGRTGISHVLEHMMFKGTKTVSGSDFSRIIAENGGNENAFTSQDFTAYFENISGDRIGIPIKLEADRMRNLVLREDDFRTERMVVLEERRMRTDDDPQAYLMEQLQAATFQTSPYHWPTIGWEEDIQRLTVKDLVAYYDLYYNPVNAFIVAVGDFHTEELLPRIEEAFGTTEKGVEPDQKKNVDPPQSGERRLRVEREAQLPFLIMAYHVPNLLSPDSYVLEVIAAILSGGKSSRLYKTMVREKKLAVSVDAENSLLSKDPSTFTVSLQSSPGKDLKAAEKALDKEIGDLQKGFVGQVELEKAKTQLEAGFVYSQQSVFSQAMLLAQHEIAADWRKVDEYVPKIGKVTAEDIKRVARLYLLPRNRSVGILVPLPPSGEKPISAVPTPKSPMIR